MKISQSDIKIEKSDKLLEHKFSIGDEGMIFNILRDKMYSNPIAAIVREVSCNARDAHREIGNTAPIEIHVPNQLEPYFSVKDYGPGISPDRIENIVVKYGVSTKRNDNNQTGGLGIGFKVPFSYQDTFEIITVTDKVKRTYLAYIDESKCGKVSLLDETPTDEPNGTLIKIDVKTNDIVKFQDAVKNQLEFFTPTPIYNLKIDANKLLLSNELFDLYSDSTKSRYYVNYNILIDDIKYSLDNELAQLITLNSYSSSYQNITGGICINFKFKNGDLLISSNRESLYNDSDKKTKKAISDKIKSVENYITNYIKNEIDKCSTIYEARLKCFDLFKYFSIEIVNKNAYFKDKKINLSNFDLGYVYKVSNCDDKLSINRVYSSNAYNSDLELTKYKMVINDSGIEDLSRVQIKSIAKSVEFDKFIIVTRKNIEKYLDYLDDRYIKSVKEIKETNKKSKRQFTLYKYNKSEKTFVNVPYTQFTECKEPNMLYYLYDKEYKSVKFNNNHTNETMLSYLNENLFKDYEIFAFNILNNDVDIEEIAEGATKAENVFKSKFSKDFEYKTLFGLSNTYYRYNYMNLNALNKLNKDNECINELMQVRDKIENILKDYKFYNEFRYYTDSIDNLLENKEDNSGKLLLELENKYNKVLEKYPLIKSLKVDTDVIDELKLYIKAKDEIYKNTTNTNSL